MKRKYFLIIFQELFNSKWLSLKQLLWLIAPKNVYSAKRKTLGYATQHFKINFKMREKWNQIL